MAAIVGCQAFARVRKVLRHSAPGRLIDIGSHRLHIHCTGEGKPAVVMDSGLPGSSLSWSLVQPEVAKFTRACSYDRAGLGWSELGPEPRTTSQIVEELHTLLVRAEIAGPYVLVGHSFGAFTVRLYASKYPEEAAGMILVDPIYPCEWLQLTSEQWLRLRSAVRACRSGAILARLGIARLVSLLVRAGAAKAARWIVSAVTGGAIREPERMILPLARLPAQLRPIVQNFWVQPKFYEALASQLQSLPESAAQVAETGPYGDIPLIVISAGNADTARTREHLACVGLSTKGKHVVALAGDHWIQLEQPELVVEVIREVVNLFRQRQ